MPPIYEVHQGPNMLAWSEALSPRTEEFRSKGEEAALKLGSAYQQIAQAKAMFPIVLMEAKARAEVANLELNEARATHSADMITMRKDAMIRKMEEEKESELAVSDFYDRYGGKILEAQALKSGKGILNIFSEAKAEFGTRAKYIMPELLKAMSTIPELQQAALREEFESKVPEAQRLAEERRKLEEDIQKAEMATEAIGNKPMEIVRTSRPKDVTEAIATFAGKMLLRPNLSEEDKAIYESLQKHPEIDKNTFAAEMYEKPKGFVKKSLLHYAMNLKAMAAGPRSLAPSDLLKPRTSLYEKGSEWSHDLEAQAIKKQFASIAAMIENPSTRDEGTRVLREFVSKKLESGPDMKKNLPADIIDRMKKLDEEEQKLSLSFGVMSPQESRYAQWALGKERVGVSRERIASQREVEAAKNARMAARKSGTSDPESIIAQIMQANPGSSRQEAETLARSKGYIQ